VKNEFEKCATPGNSREECKKDDIVLGYVYILN